jgi:predicted transcriptional regulator of viral defense system
VVKRLSRDRRRALFVLASAQSGYFTAGQALEIGYSYPAQKFHVDHGNWERVDRGIFRWPEWPPGEQDSVIRWSLWARGKGVVSHETALSVHGLGQANPAHVHLTVPRTFRATAAAVRLHKADLPESDVLDRQGFRITTVLRTLLDVAAGTLEVEDIAGALGDGLDAVLVTRRQLLSRADAFGPHAALRVERALRIVEEGS